MKTILLLAAVLLAAVAPSVQAVTLELKGDRVSLKADNDTLEAVLRAFQRQGVNIRLDHQIRERRLKADITNAPAEKAMAELIGSQGYILYWETRKPVAAGAPAVALTGIDVFRPGFQSAVRPLAAERSAGPRKVEVVPGELLVQIRRGADPFDIAQQVQALGGRVVDVIPRLGLIAVRFPADAPLEDLRRKLQENPNVAAVEPNYVYRLPPGVAGAGAPDSGALSVPRVAGDGMRLAILDSGLIQGSAVDGLVAGRYDAVNPENPLSDKVGHGTQMAYIATGAVQPAGARSPDLEAVPLLAVRAFDEEGVSTSQALMRGILYAIDNGAKVINLSWGTEVNSPFMQQVIEKAQAGGALVVAAAGNEPIGSPLYPAAYPGVLAVSATLPDGQPWAQSNYGEFVSLAAPGVAALPVGYDGPPGAYAGTSISSAYVARNLAVYRSRNPTATAEDTRKALFNSLTDKGAGGRDNTYGWGVLDATAVQRLLNTSK